ncbi:MAG: site-specific integrase [Burkholderiaceae bacterium]
MTELVHVSAAVPALIDYDLEPLDQTAYEAIKRALAIRPGQYHWLLLTKVLRASGLREAEVMALTPSHIERSGPDYYLSVRRGKRRDKSDRYERAPISAEVGAELLGYCIRVDMRQRIWHQTPRAYQLAFRRAAIEATGQPHHPHELRALCAKDLLEQGYPLEVVSKMLGHTSTDTTRRWYLRLTSAERGAIMRNVRA